MLRSQMELDVEDYGLKGISDLCNRILANYVEFPAPDANKLAVDDTLYKTVAPIQFTLSRFGEGFANYANNMAKTRNVKIATLCRYYFETYISLPRGKRECFIFSESLDKLLDAARKACECVAHVPRRIEKRFSVLFSVFAIASPCLCCCVQW